MVDYFALLKVPRRPWLDPESLKQQFLRLSAVEHPDRVHAGGETERRAAQERYTQLNSGYQCLRNEKERLAHLLELERGAPPSQLQQIPTRLMDLSLEVSQLCRQADALDAEKRTIASPLLQVSLFERSQVASEQLTALQVRINSWRQQLLAELKALDQQWEAPVHTDRAGQFQQLEELSRWFSYSSRWSGQIQERIVLLSL